MSGVSHSKQEALVNDGFCVFKNIIDSALISKLRAMSDWTIRQEKPAHFAEKRSLGCIIPYWKYPHTDFANLIALPQALKLLAQLGFQNPQAWSGFLISKPPHSPPLYWHQDGCLWNHPISYTNEAQQYFLMYYLIDTNQSNGCLRVIPGSHLRRHPIHNILSEPHKTDDIQKAADMDNPLLQRADSEIDVPVRAGDIIVGDSRLLHSAHGNSSDQWRSLITIWYWPSYPALPEDVKALIAAHVTDTPEWQEWCNQNSIISEKLIPTYNGRLKPVVWGRHPNSNLK